jgi:hypothetical protein
MSELELVSSKVLQEDSPRYTRGWTGMTELSLVAGWWHSRLGLAEWVIVRSDTDHN